MKGSTGLEKVKENIYQYKVEDIVIEYIYQSNGKKLEECLLNILKHKMKK